MRRAIISGAVGFLICLIGVFAVDTARFITNSPNPSDDSAAHPMQAAIVDPSWIKSGNPKFAQSETFRSPDGRTVAGLWSCEGPTTFVWQFGVDETVHLLEGEVLVDYLGNKFTLLPGDVATFHGGTQATWTIDTYAKKAYVLHNPGPAGRLWRSIFQPS
jgi:uncharacterized protein